MQEPAGKKQVNKYIEQLKSDDDARCEEAKEKLLQLGDEAIPPLLSLLEALLQQHDKSPDQEAPEVSRLLGPRDNRSSLQGHVMDVLGRLRAEKAIPLLLWSIEERGVWNLMEKMYADMRALIAIGPAAVPQLIEEINEADAKAKRFPQGTPAGSIRVRAAIVLGEIGDVRALPVLEELDKQRGHTGDTYVPRAIAKIKAKNNLK